MRLGGGNTTTDTPNPSRLQKHLSGVDYPAEHDDLVNAARGQGADEEIIKALQGIPDKEHDGPNAVSEAVSGKS
ncbi:DUF2795 domain-containing protein [Streptosporangium sp. CA-135522]|uniref:DUF2795 domain-containing protein n=1 Tax=Streptosporangium sp. CA-135522 TaxID=3240072 RepID=UPI003D94E896